MRSEYEIIINKQKRGFTLAEVMIVLLVLTMLLAVFAPFITKRKHAKTENLWQWSTRNYLAGPMDIFFNPADGNSPSLFIGMSPDSSNEIDDIYAPLGKIIIRGGYLNNSSIQHQIQLRHGRTNFADIGNYSGSILMDNENILVGARYDAMVPKQTDATYPKSNIAFGFSSLNEIGDRGAGNPPALHNVAIGNSALQQLHSGESNVAVGANSGFANLSAAGNTTIGYNSGIQTTANYNTLIGYKSTSASGMYNTLIGAETGQQPNMTTKTYHHNTGIGYQALSHITSGEYNTAIGSGALKNLQDGNYNVAIGYNACSNITSQSYKTCIGYNSGPASGSDANAELGIGIDDSALRTYIGTNPNMAADGTWSSPTANNFGGDAVLEIHNVGGTNEGLINNPEIKSNTTTIINGNLVVKGRTFLTIGKVLYPFYYNSNIFGTVPDGTSSEACTNSQSSYAFVNTEGSKCTALSNLSSDRRLKNIGLKYNEGLNEINRIKTYDYTFKYDKENRKHTGVLAQELQKIFPNSVMEDENGYLIIRWDEMFYASINAIKELNARIVSLVKQTLSLENQIDKLEKDNEELKIEITELSSRIEKLKNK